jgi:putative methyltransferase (TIGR04325 family)
MNQLKSFIKDWLPPTILRRLRRINSHSIYFEGSYNTWEEASALCGGYDDKSILEKVLNSTLKVKRGEAAYERDSVVFNEPDYVWPVTTALMWAAAKSGGKLHVLDFGGSLGSTYFQNRAFLKDLSELRWSVIEQSHYVEAGREFIEDEHIQFYESVSQLPMNYQPNIVVFSSVLQYLPNFEQVLQKVSLLKPGCMVIDRTPFFKKNGNLKNGNLIVRQTVPPHIYPASYPMWIFDQYSFFSNLKSNWQIVALNSSPEGAVRTREDIMFYFMGAILEYR